MELKKGSIIQANENAKSWCGCVLIVDEIKSWGVQAFLHIPMQGDAYIRLQHDQYDALGTEAVLMPGEHAESICCAVSEYAHIPRTI